MKSHILFATVATLLVVLGGVAVYDADGSDAATDLKIIFNGDGGSPVPSTIIKANDGSSMATVTIPTTVPSKEGYKFLYWVDEAEGTTPIYPGTEETFPWGTWGLAAVYEAQTTYTVTFSAGNGGKVSQTSLTVPAGTTITENGNQLIFKDGDNLVGIVTATPNSNYEFADWLSLKDMTAVNSDMTISAIFIGEMVTITIKAGTGGTVSDSQIFSTYGSKVTASGNTLTIGSTTVTATPNSGYTFSSWSNVPTTVTAATTITANFSKTATIYDFEVDINLAGGSASFKLNWKWTSTDNPDTFHIPDEVPTKAGYRFVEYTTVTEAGTEHLQPGDDLDMLSDWSVLTLTAVWERVTYTVTISAGTGGSVTPTTVEVPHNSAVSANGNTLTIGSTTVTATPNSGYTFSSWSKTSGTITSNTTITATFERAEVTYLVTYYANGGSGAPVGISASTYDLSWSFTIPDSEPRRSGYTFGGWEAVYNGSASGTIYKPGDTVTLSAVLPEIVLKAEWTPISTGDAFTIYASADGWVYDGKTYAYDTVTLFYSEIAPIYIDGREYAGGHIYLQLGNRGTVLDLGVSSPDFEIKLGGQWAVSTAFSAGESSITTKTEMKPWGWNWDISLVAIAFVGILALVTVVVNYLAPSGLRPMDWIVIGIAGVVGVALMVL